MVNISKYSDATRHVENHRDSIIRGLIFLAAVSTYAAGSTSQAEVRLLRRDLHNEYTKSSFFKFSKISSAYKQYEKAVL